MFTILRKCDDGIAINSPLIRIADRKIFLYSYSHIESSFRSPGRESPALLISTSSVDVVRLISSNSDFIASEFIRSAWQSRPLEIFSTSLSVSCAPALFFPKCTNTCARFWAKAMAVSLQMPLEAPVTNTIFSRRSMRHHNSNSRLAKTGRSAKDVALYRRRACDASRALMETAQALAKGQGA